VKVIGKLEGIEEEIGRRLVTAVISQWDRFPNWAQEGLLRDASVSVDVGSPGMTSLEGQIKDFIRKHRDALREGA
jgi:hypothetical protein